MLWFKKVFDGQQNNNYLIISLSEMYYLYVYDIKYRLQNVKTSRQFIGFVLTVMGLIFYLLCIIYCFIIIIIYCFIYVLLLCIVIYIFMKYII